MVKTNDIAQQSADNGLGTPATRFAAGADPAKREQIIDGARRVFMKLGFDAASMNDVTREAGVSKGTIYVYFSSKEELFAALVDREKTRFAESLRDVMAGTNDAADGLERFARAFVQQVTGSDMVPAMRTVLGVVDRMPGLCRRFFATTPNNAKAVLEQFLARQVAIGALVIPDIELAARQFIDLSTGTFFKLRLFDDIKGPPAAEEVDRVVMSAVSMFLKTYRAGS
ncbi:TetR/AcrR family transcriptional regulator [Ciceribacter sp. L1K23]|uniref:TetR/AcrR family transcriptional regulator n=1 Tax=Ciceribacter sp. L1K23 TaxID=2820276 RepID=UPI001B838582|nr:TetR/AcrR family transcriptional regulator [Ciceribacter sp. L1K23]MBR0558077.1 TetR/AcrR family transcriptional regulator [Ciceribacter sp. L1K23]